GRRVERGVALRGGAARVDGRRGVATGGHRQGDDLVVLLARRVAERVLVRIDRGLHVVEQPAHRRAVLRPAQLAPVLLAQVGQRGRVVPSTGVGLAEDGRLRAGDGADGRVLLVAAGVVGAGRHDDQVRLEVAVVAQVGGGEADRGPQRRLVVVGARVV